MAAGEKNATIFRDIKKKKKQHASFKSPKKTRCVVSNITNKRAINITSGIAQSV
jgi:hypothetical protein